MYDKLVVKVNNTYISGFVLETKHDTDKSDLKKIPNTSGLVKKKQIIIAKTEIEDRIPNIDDLAINSALTAVKNKLPDVSNLVKTNRL